MSPDKSWLLVDVVGRVEALSLDADDYAQIPISASPVYVLSQRGYQELTGQSHRVD